MTAQSVLDAFAAQLQVALGDDYTVRDAGAQQQPNGWAINGLVMPDDAPIVLVFPPPPGNARRTPCDNAGDCFEDFDIEWHLWVRCESVDDPPVSDFRNGPVATIKQTVFQGRNWMAAANTTTSKVLFFGDQLTGGSIDGETPWQPVKDWPISRHAMGRVHVREFVTGG